jgi:steroid 5-alpha reductase family enzyme
MSGRGLATRFSKGGSLALVLVAYVFALEAAWLTAHAFGGSRPVLALSMGYLAAAIVIYVWSLSVDNGSMFDAWWSVMPAAAALWLAHVATTGVPHLRIVLVLIAVLVWALRLTSNWARDWPGLHHEDWRYLDLYTKGPKPLISLGAVHIFPAFMVFFISLPMVPALVWGHSAVSWVDWIALIVCLKGAAIEFVADEQMRRFARNKKPGDIMKTGLWKYSRHPNYFGELLFWWGLWLFALASDLAWWWTVVGPVALTGMFLGASIPLIDARSLERRPGFEAYASRTSRLLPLPPKKA